MKQSLPDAARGKACTIRFTGICNNDWSTSVLCHFREAHVAGTAMKPNDLIAAIGCSACHDHLDQRTTNEDGIFDPVDTTTYKHQAMIRTLDYWIQNGELSTNMRGELRWESLL